MNYVLLLSRADREAHENVYKAEGERHEPAKASFVVGMGRDTRWTHFTLASRTKPFLVESARLYETQNRHPIRAGGASHRLHLARCSFLQR
jgi:hypothetical protein